MGFFTKKLEKNVEPTIEERLRGIEARINRLSAEILDIATAQEIIRNKVLKKIQFKRATDPDDDPKSEKDLYGGMLLPEK